MVECQFALTLVVLVTFSVTHLARSEIYTALAQLERVLHAEQGVAQDLKLYIQAEEQRISTLKRIVEEYEAHSSNALLDAGKHLSNPVNAFLLVKKFTTDWQKVQTLLRNNSYDNFIERLSVHTVNFPDYEDLTGAATALLRLQDTYALHTEKIARGEIEGVKYSPKMAAEDCYELGRIAYNNGDYYHTILWMEQALERWEKETIKTIDRPMLYDYLAYAVYVQGDIKRALALTNELLSVEPDHIRAQNNKKYYMQMIAEQEAATRKKGDDSVTVDDKKFVNKRNLDEYRQSSEFQIYEKLCRGEEVKKRPDKHQLRCQNKRHHPFYYIRPLHEETVSFKPWIVLYHDLMTESEVEIVKVLATPKLHRSGVFTWQDSDTGIYSQYRTSKSAWLRDADHPLIARISGKVRFMTNLTLETAEELQVVNYGIGGHYEPHYDFARPEERSSFDPKAGNRIMTVIYYMSDVEAGGATVFPAIGVRLLPRKGSCAVWYNLLANGEGDYDTRHAACPVLTGTKWVCNKWIHERGQEFVRPCSSDPNL